MPPKPILVPVGIFLVCWLLLSSPWLLGDYTIPYDAKAHFQAQIQFLAQALHSGQSPFWTPHVFTGSPQIADPQSLIFSPAIVLAFLSPNPSFAQVDAFILLLLALGGLGILLFFHDKGWHPLGGVLAGLAFSFGASAAWRIQHVGQIISYCLFSITLWLLARALAQGSWRSGLAAGVAAAVMVVKPDQVALLGCYLLAGFVLDEGLRRRGDRQALLKMVRPLLSAALACLVLVLVPLLLTALFAASTTRFVIPYEIATRGSLHPAQLLTGVIADLFGALDPKINFWGPSSGSWGNLDLDLSQNMGQIYVGALPALLILGVGATRGVLWLRDIRFFTIAWLLMVAYALGRYSPLFDLAFYYLPVIKEFRRPADATFFIGALSAILSGFVLHRWMSGLVPVVRGWRRGLELGIFISLFVMAGGVALAEHHLTVAIKPLILSAVWLSVAIGLLWLVRQAWAQRHERWAWGLVALVVSADLYANNGPNESTALLSANYEILRKDCQNETVRFLSARLRPFLPSDRRDRVELAGVGFDWPNIGMIQGFENTLGYNPLRLAHFAEATGAGDTLSAPDQRHFTPIFPSYNSIFANMLGIRYIATAWPIEQMDHGLKPNSLRLLTRTKDAYIYENTHALPRVQFIRQYRVADFEQLKKDGRWPENFDHRRELVLEEAPVDVPEALALPPQVSAGTAHKIALTHYENTQIDIEVEARNAGFVLLNDVYHPWWQASIDGVEVPTLVANLMFRAVYVTAGKHKVRFVFQPVEGAFSEISEKWKQGREEVPDVSFPSLAVPE